MEIFVSYLILGIITLVGMYIDSSMGGGYGTIIVPVLLFMGYEFKLIVPAILFSEIWAGFILSSMHHIAGNAHFEVSHEEGDGLHFHLSKDLKISLLMGICGLVGGIFAALVALNISEVIIATYIGSLVILMGVLVFFKFHWKFSWKKIMGIGFLASFNKGISGGGYGPIIASGQVISERNPKESMATSSLAEAIVSISAFLTYLIGGHLKFDWMFVLVVTIGAIASVPFTVYTIKYMPVEKLQPLMGSMMIVIGILTLLNTFVF